MFKVDEIDCEKLIFDLSNPRFFRGLSDQRQALHVFCGAKYAGKTVTLAKHITENGLSPAELLIVARAERRGQFVVLEGNRRLAALKLLSHTDRISDAPLSSAYKSRLRQCAVEVNRTVLRRVPCKVLEREEARIWIALKHTGENEGSGVVQWDGEESSRFRGNGIGYRLLDAVRQHGTDEAKKYADAGAFPVTNLERLVFDPHVRSALGLEISKAKGEIKITHDIEQVLRALSSIVTALGKGEISVSDIKTKELRRDYIDSLQGHLPEEGAELADPVMLDMVTHVLTELHEAQNNKKPVGEEHVTRGSGSRMKDADSSKGLVEPGGDSGATEVGGSSEAPKDDGKTGTTNGGTRAYPINRKTVIPFNCAMPINRPKVLAVFNELKALRPLDRYLCAASVLLRILVDTTSLEYVVAAGIGSGGDVLRVRVEKMLTDLTDRDEANREACKALKNCLLQRGPLNVEQLHIVVHGRIEHPPTDKELIKGWHEIEPALTTAWKVIQGLAK